MFEDDNLDGSIESAESVIRYDGPPGNAITISANHPLDNYISYTTFGYARLLNGALQMGTFVVCKPGQKAGMVRHIGFEDDAEKKFREEKDANGITWEYFSKEAQRKEIEEKFPNAVKYPSV